VEQKTEVLVHVHYRLARGGVTGNYDFWTLLLQNPIVQTLLLGVGSAIIYDLLKALAKKIVSLLSGATTRRAKRVDTIIPVENGSVIVVRTVCVGDAFAEARIPSEDEVRRAIESAMAAYRVQVVANPSKPIVVSISFQFRTNTNRDGTVTTEANIRTRAVVMTSLLPGVQDQIAQAKSVKPVLLDEETQAG